MDTLVHTALEEICCTGPAGILLTALFPKLTSSTTICPHTKQSLHHNLLQIPSLRFESRRGEKCDPTDPKFQNVEDAERAELRIIADEHVRNNFLGIYDVAASNAGISEPMRRTLERLAIARTNGITQNELTKEFGTKGNKIFYVLKSLETRGLITRQSTLVRKKEACNEREPKNISISTQMLHLYRYAKHLGCQQKLEITKEDNTFNDTDNADGIGKSGDAISEESIKENVHVKDYLPAMKAICDKLEKAEDKVLVVSDLKQDLGYVRTPGHRAWRNIRARLKDAGLVEEFFAKVNNKEVCCLRLLKKFTPNILDRKTHGGGGDDLDTEQLVKLERRGQITDQLVELPIDHQVYDMIDAEGSKGLVVNEIYKRLGINNKRYYTRFLNIFDKLKMPMKSESVDKSAVYRVWTSKNFNPEGSKTTPSKLDGLLNETEQADPCAGEASSALSVETVDYWDSQTTVQVETENFATDQAAPHGVADTSCNDMKVDCQENDKLLDIECQIVSGCPSSNFVQLDVPPSVSVSPGRVPDEELQLVCSRSTADSVPPDSSAPPRRRKSYQKYPCLNLNAVSEQRERRILEFLEEEKFLVQPELHKRLESLEKEKNTAMCKKTLVRSLNKLQLEGHLKCIHVSVPGFTNCGRNRIIDVILHPSIYDSYLDILDQIHDRFRSFEMQRRVQCYFKLKKGTSVPVLDNVERIHSSVLEVQAERSEAMNSNGFVLAKMIRSKLFHIFLWSYFNNLPDWDDALASAGQGLNEPNPHTTSRTFDLDSATKDMPLELFLQVVGSTNSIEDMVEKCRNGMRLSDLPVEEYRCLVDTHATSRLSRLIDILRRLKLIRLISVKLINSTGVQDATLRHTIELNPYIEEPVAVIPSPDFVSLDLRPCIRHDFVLSNREAVDDYWNTLEYCYAAANPKAALHSFPGSSVHEVFNIRSWASSRVMTAQQRDKLLKRISNLDPDKKLSFKECEEIAKDLILAIEQVLRVYYDQRRKRLTRFRPPGAQKRKAPEGKPMKDERVEKVPKLSDAKDLSNEQGSFVNSIGDHETRVLSNEKSGERNDVEPTGEVESLSDDDLSTIEKRALARLMPKRRKKFSWTEDGDRQLVIEYARHRAHLGANFHRVDWATLPNLPAPPETCRRRMALLNSCSPFRKAVMRLCSMLCARYANHSENLQNKSLGDNCGKMIRYCTGHEHAKNNTSCCDHTDTSIPEERWDDFDNEIIRKALDEALSYKKTTKREVFRDVGSTCQFYKMNWVDAGHDRHPTTRKSSRTRSKKVRRKAYSKRSRRQRLPKKYLSLVSKVTDADKQAYGSLAVSNAAELFKLIFLSTSSAPEVSRLLAETLRRYSEHDLFAAFSYLRDRKIMVGGNGTSPFGLSLKFLQKISSSPFPVNTGKRAVKMSNWIHERENDLLGGGVNLFADLECGDVFHLCALLSSGELSICPCLPNEGVGEGEDLKKRKLDNDEICSIDKTKKVKTTMAGEVSSRREKGFPGIQLLLARTIFSSIDALKFSNNENEKVNFSSSLNLDHGSSPHDVNETPDFGGIIPDTIFLNESSPWQDMTSYAARLHSHSLTKMQEKPFCPDLFRTVYSAIQKSGDQGLSMERVLQVVDMQGERTAELVVEVLEVFGRIFKVNGYDSVHFVDYLYRSKYFLTSTTALHQDHEVCPSIIQPENHEDQGTSLDELHRVTILNLPEEVVQPLGETTGGNENLGESETTSLRGELDNHKLEKRTGSAPFCRPILPWVNGDGTINEIVYKGLVRRVLGIVMQNPGILEDNLITHMQALTPQSCRRLLQLMILDNHIFVRKMYQSVSSGPPAILGRLVGNACKKPKFVYRDHLFANPMSVRCL